MERRAPAPDSRLELWPTGADQNFATAWLAEKFPSRAPLIVMHPSGGRSALKQWPVGNFLSLLRILKNETSCNFLIIGGGDEGWIAEEFRGEVSDRCIVAVGQFTLRQLTAIFQKAEAFIGGDSGPMHLAAAAGTKVITVFGSTSEVRFRPWSDNSIVVSEHYPCSPDQLGTFDDRCKTCRFDEPRCLTTLSVASVRARLETKSLNAVLPQGGHP